MNNNTNGIRHILRALRYPNYRLFFFGQIVSLTGTWMQFLAMGWLVYRITNSPQALGLIGFASQITTFFISPFAGVWADQWNRHKTVIITQVLAMLQAFILAALVLSGNVKLWHIVALALFLGVVNSFDMPVRQSFTIDMVRNKEDLGNAIALNSLMFNAARFIGPTVAGIVVARWNEGVCFLLNAVSYLAVIVALLAMKDIPVNHAAGSAKNVLSSMKEGFVYTFGFAPMRLILSLMGLVSLVIMPYGILMPVFARDVLHGDARMLGFLMGAAGLGALAGAVFLAAKKSAYGMGRTIMYATFVLGLGVMAVSFMTRVVPALLLMIVVGFGIMVHMAASNTVLQTIVDDDKRGRVMSFYIMAFIGLTPFGSLLAGHLASAIGVSRTLMFAGLLAACGALVFSRRMGLFDQIIAKSALTES